MVLLRVIYRCILVSPSQAHQAHYHIHLCQAIRALSPCLRWRLGRSELNFDFAANGSTPEDLITFIVGKPTCPYLSVWIHFSVTRSNKIICPIDTKGLFNKSDQRIPTTCPLLHEWKPSSAYRKQHLGICTTCILPILPAFSSDVLPTASIPKAFDLNSTCWKTRGILPRHFCPPAFLLGKSPHV